MSEELRELIRMHISNQSDLIAEALDVNHCNVRLFSVGNGNSSIISLNNEGEYVNILYDFGRCTNNVSENNSRINFFNDARKVEENVPNLAYEDINYIILSHWDMDHINGFSQSENLENLENMIHLKKIIVPSPIVLSAAASRLVAYLIKNFKQKLIFLDDQRGNVILSNGLNSSVTIYKGLGKSGNYNRQNNLGLSLLINRNDRNLLLTGDCEYHQIPLIDGVLINNFVIPHHGAYSAQVNAIQTSDDALIYSNSGRARINN